MKRQIVLFLQTRFINPTVRPTAGTPGNRYALLETVGRKTGQPRQTPVGNGLDGDVFWIVRRRCSQGGQDDEIAERPGVG